MKQFNLEEYLKNPSRKVVTRDGRNVRILCTDAKGDYPIVALIATLDGSIEFVCKFKKDGHFLVGDNDSNLDLFFVPEKYKGWVNIYRGCCGPITSTHIFSSKEEAEESSMHCCGFTKGLYLTTVKVEWEE